MMPIPFNNSYSRLPETFYKRLSPQAVSAPQLITVNDALARELGIDIGWLHSEEGIAALAGNTTPEGAEPLAAVYAGHQFGNYNPQLGDGRAILLGEVINRQGKRLDIQLKGSGRTPYSRGGDGRSPLGPVLREYLISEAMQVLGVPTTRALAAVATGEQVMRDRPLPGAILTRVASSHIRIGSFQYFAAQFAAQTPDQSPEQKQQSDLYRLMKFSLERHYPEYADSDNPALALLQQVITAQATLVSQWQLLGFIHGVMNTDNMLISGETIDYGPCAFMDSFHPDTVYSSIDQQGRYAYRNQPGIAHWNLAALAQALLPLLHDDQEQGVALAQEAVDTFPAQYEAAHLQGLAVKLGLSELTAKDMPLVEALFTAMTDAKADYTLSFRRLTEIASETNSELESLYPMPDALIPWLSQWRQRFAQDKGPLAARLKAMNLANPAFIPRNHLVEEAIRAAEDHGDLRPFHDLHDRLQQPFGFDADDSEYALPPRPEQVVANTFCGT